MIWDAIAILGLGLVAGALYFVTPLLAPLTVGVALLIIGILGGRNESD